MSGGNGAEATRTRRSIELGTIVMTANAKANVDHDDVFRALTRHASGDWGEVCVEDWDANELALKNGTRLLSTYTSTAGIKFWIITEWDRSYTTILLPEDY